MAIDTIRTLVELMQTQHLLFPAPSSTPDAQSQVVVVAVSGGADSVCLLDLLVQLAPRWHLTLHVAHLDHALRTDSAADADFVATLAAAYRVPFHRKRLPPGTLAASGGSIEEAARRARYAFLAKVALAVTPAAQQPIVALAHHADDQAETVLHHLVRGSSLHGLGGMRPMSNYRIAPTEPAIRLVRPLLAVTRAAILDYLTQRQLTWREDNTNLDQRYTRNYLRHTILPALTAINPEAVAAIGRLAALAADDSARLAAYDVQLLRSLQWPPVANAQEPYESKQTGQTALPEFVFNLDALLTLPHATQRALLRLAALSVDATAGELTLAQLELLCQQIADTSSSGPHPLAGKLQWTVAGATAAHPTLLSVHRTGQLPLVQDRPLLPEGAIVALPLPTVGESHTVALAGGWQLTVTALSVAALPADWRTRNQPWRTFFDRAELQQPQLTTPAAGQRIAPLGLNGHHKLIGDLFTDHKIPNALRLHWPLLVDGATNEVHWVCGLQPGHLARVQAETHQVVCVQFTRDESVGQ